MDFLSKTEKQKWQNPLCSGVHVHPQKPRFRQICTWCLPQLWCSLPIKQKEKNNTVFFWWETYLLSGRLTSSEIYPLTSYSVLPLSTRSWTKTRCGFQSTAIALTKLQLAAHCSVPSFLLILSPAWITGSLGQRFSWTVLFSTQ